MRGASGGRLFLAIGGALGLAMGCRDDAAAPKAGAMSGLDHALADAVSPGPLALAHAHLDAVSDCTSCHTGVSGTPDALCLDCHADVGERMAKRIGVHGGFEGSCASCHPDHRGVDADLLGLDREAFNHERATFPLRGAHAEVKCEECHTRVHPDTRREGFHPLGIAHELCATCHEDPHGSAFAGERDCGACHAEAGWSARFLLPAGDTGFRHDRDTEFRLDGAHARVACGECHTPERAEAERAERLAPASSAPQDCAGCHRDVHEAALGPKCASCHVAAAWKGAESGFDHARHTHLALDALHARLACADCHADARFRSEGRECASCHPDAAALQSGRFGELGGAADPHAGRVDCRACHPAALADPHLRDYERLCADCHTPEYAALLRTRTRLIDEAALRAEGVARRLVLARRRGDSAAPAADLAASEPQLERLARSGAHNPALAEAALAEHVRRLEAALAEGEAKWTQ